MPEKKVLVLGGTGPAGICLLRELVYRKHSCFVFARSPSKIPEDLRTSPLLEIIQGELSEVEKLSAPMADCSSVISLLGPSVHTRNIDPAVYSDFYKALFPLMRQHNVRRILAMGTLSIQRPEDHWTLLAQLAILFIWLFVTKPYRSVLNIGGTFEADAGELDWTVYRIAGIPGESDNAGWMKDREAGRIFEGWVGEKGWTISTPRGALARWLVDAVEGGADKWIRKMPAIGLHA